MRAQANVARVTNSFMMLSSPMSRIELSRLLFADDVIGIRGFIFMAFLRLPKRTCKEETVF